MAKTFPSASGLSSQAPLSFFWSSKQFCHFCTKNSCAAYTAVNLQHKLSLLQLVLPHDRLWIEAGVANVEPLLVFLVGSCQLTLKPGLDVFTLHGTCRSSRTSPLQSCFYLCVNIYVHRSSCLPLTCRLSDFSHMDLSDLLTRIDFGHSCIPRRIRIGPSGTKIDSNVQERAETANWRNGITDSSPQAASQSRTQRLSFSTVCLQASFLCSRMTC